MHESPGYRLIVKDLVTAALTGRPSQTYQSPPLARQDALALAGLLLGRDARALAGNGPWWNAIVGGRRIVRLTG
jgi:hypothetical protein